MIQASAHRRLGFAAGFVAASSIGASVSGAVFHSELPLPVQTIPAVSDFQTTGEDMAGMSVTVFFSGAAAETAIWQAGPGPGAGFAAGTEADWRLSQSGDTFSNPWTLEYIPGQTQKGLLTGFRIDGFAAGPGEVGVMFDRTFDFNFGTPGSFHGRDYTSLSGEDFDTLVVYEGSVGVGMDAPVGDEFRWLNVRFAFVPDDEFGTAPPRVGGLDGVDVRTVSFLQDTNNPIIPEPASAGLLIGASVLGLLRRRRRA